MIEILSELFKKTKTEEIEKIVYLMQGRLAPFFVHWKSAWRKKPWPNLLPSPMEKKEDVIKDFNKLGDMGLAAEEFKLRNTKSQNSRH